MLQDRQDFHLFHLESGMTARMERWRVDELCLSAYVLFSTFLLELCCVSSTVSATVAAHRSHSYVSFQHQQRYFSGKILPLQSTRNTYSTQREKDAVTNPTLIKDFDISFASCRPLPAWGCCIIAAILQWLDARCQGGRLRVRAEEQLCN